MTDRTTPFPVDELASDLAFLVARDAALLADLRKRRPSDLEEATRRARARAWA